jgi:ribokinase
MNPIVVVGSINMDLVTMVDAMPRAGETLTGQGFSMHPGGKGANQAVAAARLGQPVKMIGMVGDDAFGKTLRSGLERDGIDVGGVAVCEGSSGVASILVDARGENSIVVTPGANLRVTPEYLRTQADALRGAGMVLAQLEIPLESVIWLAEFLAEAHISLMLDPAPAQRLPTELYPLIDFFTPNETEAEFYLDRTAPDPAAVAEGLLARGCTCAVLKRGDKGALVARRGEMYSIEPYRVSALDTTAAGDCFNGALAAGLNDGMPLREAAEFAARAAAISVTRRGAQESMPTLDEVRAFRGE